MRPGRDNRLIDTLEAIAPVPFAGRVWRAMRDVPGRDVLRCGASGGRWDDKTFDVLYTSTHRQGAIEECRYHLTKGQPFPPSQVHYRLLELDVTLSRVLRFDSLERLSAVGLETAKYGRLSYEKLSDEYPTTQQIGEVAQFLDFDGLLVPSARYDCLNLVVFCEKSGPDARSVVKDHGLIGW